MAYNIQVKCGCMTVALVTKYKTRRRKSANEEGLAKSSNISCNPEGKILT